MRRLRRAVAAVVVAEAAPGALAGAVRPSAVVVAVAVVGGPPRPPWFLKTQLQSDHRQNPLRQRIWTSTLCLPLIRVQLEAPPTAGRSRSNRSAPQAGSPTPSTAPAPGQPTAADDDTSDQSESSDDGLFLLHSARRPCFSWRWRRRMEQKPLWATFLHAEDKQLDDLE